MNKNYYYLKVADTLDISAIKIPTSDFNIVPISGNAVVKFKFDDGNEMLRVIANGTTELYSSFPIDITAQF